MTFIEAIKAYHEGKKIRRPQWSTTLYWSKEEMEYIVKYGTEARYECRASWNDILADDWVVDE